MMASRDAFPLCDKPFYGKEKFIRCGVCEVRSHCACLQLGEAEQATLTAEGESVYKCNACANSSGIDMNPAHSPGSPANEGATSCASSPAEMFPKEAASNQRMSSAALPTQALPTISVPAGTTLPYRDVAVAGISPSGPTALPDPDGFKTVTYRNRTTTNPPAESAVVNKVIPRRQPLIGVSSSQSLPVVKKAERSKALFVSRFRPEVTSDDVHKSLKEQLSILVNSIEMDLRQLGWEGMDWIDVAQDRDQRMALVNTVMNLLVP
ncbi:hypothetical protein B7P43_G11564 [Cryptotermes secundus]|uniref:Uncharacterized protein n=1 Tax=Cryptotermes secundus TaxID=105785 RepID=A0A2J7RL75_9NEOP|nr:hypothetical protein B7P43_G11564 [Cryptotermes secundus]